MRLRTAAHRPNVLHGGKCGAHKFSRWEVGLEVEQMVRGGTKMGREARSEPRHKETAGPENGESAAADYGCGRCVFSNVQGGLADGKRRKADDLHKMATPSV